MFCEKVGIFAAEIVLSNTMHTDYIEQAGKELNISSVHEEATAYYVPSKNELRIQMPAEQMDNADIEAISAQVSMYVRYLLNNSKKDISKSIPNKMTLEQAKEFLHSQRLQGTQEVPEDFNGMKDEVNPKYL